MSSFRLPISKMTISLDDVSQLQHLSIIGRLLNYSKTSRPDALDIMLTYLRADPGKFQPEINDIRGCYARFSFLVTMYEHYMATSMDADGDDAQVVYHKAYVH